MDYKIAKEIGLANPGGAELFITRANRQKLDANLVFI